MAIKRKARRKGIHSIARDGKGGWSREEAEVGTAKQVKLILLSN